MQTKAISDMMAKRIKNKVNPLSAGSLSIQPTLYKHCHCRLHTTPPSLTKTPSGARSLMMGALARS